MELIGEGWQEGWQRNCGGNGIKSCKNLVVGRFLGSFVL